MGQIYKQYFGTDQFLNKWITKHYYKVDRDKATDRILLRLTFREYVSEKIGDRDKNDPKYIRSMRRMDHRMDIDELIYDGKAIHLFMPSDDLCDLIAEATRPGDTRESMLELDVKLQDLLYHKFGDSVVVMHFRNGSKYPTVAFQRSMIDEKDSTALCLNMDDKESVMPLAINIRPDWIRNPAKDDTGGRDDAYHRDCNKMAPLLYGLGLYLNAFPDMLKDGAPADLAHPSHHKYKRKMMVEDNKVLTTDHHNGKIPHFRMGHFRTYQSERYVNVRLQVKWIEGVFIKGRAKHVDDATEAPKAQP